MKYLCNTIYFIDVWLHSFEKNYVFYLALYLSLSISLYIYITFYLALYLSISLSLYMAYIYTKHNQYWVLVFRPIEEAVEPLGFVPIGVKFSTLPPLLHHPVLLFLYLSISLIIPSVALSKTPTRSISS